jgi:hypothetical protein
VTPDALAVTLADVRRLRRGFAHTAPQPWTAATAAAEMTVQVGHLALCLLSRLEGDTVGLTDAQRPITDVGDELADVLLAIMSVAILAGGEPAPAPQPARDAGEIDTLLRLLTAAGQLAEAAMVGDGFRHEPAGVRPSISAASGTAVAACEGLARHLGLDLLAEFRAMVADAEAFLGSWRQPR